MKTKITTLIIVFTLFVWRAKAQTQLWGTCYYGGTTNAGTIFTADGNGNNFHRVYSFVNATGQAPIGSMTLANNGSFYGVTELGGFGDSCVVYRYNPVTGVYTNIHDLFQFFSLGYYPQSGMLNASDGKLYGLCPEGGAYNGGVIFKIDPVTDIYTDIYDFAHATGYSADGSLIQATDGNLYGYTSKGGADSIGVLFKFNPSTNIYSNLFNFDTISGFGVFNGKLTQGNDGKLYGTTNRGGANLSGVIFSYDISTNSYSVLYNFASGVANLTPISPLIQASDGKLYGNICFYNYYGCIYSFDLNTNTFTNLHNFDTINGSTPARALMQGSNGKLYGTTEMGGINNKGVAFSYDITTSTFAKLIDFDSATIGAIPNCELVETPAITGIPSLQNNPSLKIFPNPAVDYINIISSSQEETIQFTDVLGRELAIVKTNAFSKTHVDVSTFPNVFFVKSKEGVQKVVKK